jgi:hypothetical protein
MAEIPSPPKHTMTDFGNRMQISIPSQKQWLLLIILPIWLCGWVFGEVSAIHKIMNDGLTISILIWIIGWTFGGVFAILMILWQIAGKEIIEISNRSIFVSKTIFNIGFPTEYSVRYLKDLRMSSIIIANNDSQWGRTCNSDYSLMGYQKLAFDYGAITIRFGYGIDEAEAKQILNNIQQKYPQYKTE